MNTIETYIVDSFTDEPFKGNPAGVCLIETEISDDRMLSIAKELGLSETAFVRYQKESNTYAIRYFSPKMEIPLCGHATLAASKVLFENSSLNLIHFKNIQNLDLIIKKDQDQIIMEFPVYNTTPDNAPDELINALGIQKVVNTAYNKETHILLLEIDDVDVLRSLKPDFDKLIKSHNDINGVLVTALSNNVNCDFESRYFWPWSGTNEDPATGGTHTFLAKYWSEKLNKKKMHSFQCSERSGFMEVELLSNSKMLIKSKAQIIFKGALYI
jgi:PhzF family phenazine biosynthesis protein